VSLSIYAGMNKIACISAILMAMIGLSFVGARPGEAAAEACFDDWSAAAVAVKKHGLVPVDKLGALARSKAKGLLVRTELCKQDGDYVYKIVLREERGGLKRMVVSAKSPFGHDGAGGK
jgi:uncharacterized membrane protein YkoI